MLLGGTLVSAYGWESRPVSGPTNEQIGEQIFGTWVWPFELLSLLLLVALVAALAVSRVARQPAPTQPAERAAPDRPGGPGPDRLEAAAPEAAS